jgi:predicted nucleic acid-binding protein
MIASSNTSTLINFYRTDHYPILKVLFEKILIPKNCWTEMISGDVEIDKQHSDRVRLLADKDTFLIIMDVAVEDGLVQELTNIAGEIFERAVLDEPEATAIALAVDQNCEVTLSDDRVARRVVEVMRDRYPGRKLPEISNTGDVLRMAVEQSIISFSSADEIREFIQRFEKEARIILSRKSRDGIMDGWTGDR